MICIVIPGGRGDIGMPEQFLDVVDAGKHSFYRPVFIALGVFQVALAGMNVYIDPPKGGNLATGSNPAWCTRNKIKQLGHEMS